MAVTVELTVQCALDAIETAKQRHWRTLMSMQSSLDLDIVVKHGNFCKRLDVIAERIKQTDDAIVIEYLRVACDMEEAAEALSLGDMPAVARVIRHSQELRHLE